MIGIPRQLPATLLSIGLVLALCISTIGCGGPTIYPVAGNVVFSDGEVVQNGKIEFRSTEGPWRAMGDLDTKGRFRLRTMEGDDGLPAGTYDVVVLQIIMTEDLSISQHNHGRPVPARYADYFTSGLRTTVSADNSEAITITIEPK